MYEQSLIHIGLSYPQSLIYEKLIKGGPQKAGKIALNTPFKRGLVYKTLEELVKMELVEKKEYPRKVAIFEAKHPLSLRELAEKKEQKARDAKKALEGMLSSIVSDFNLTSSKPGVSIYEGMEGVKKVIYDTFSSKEVVYTYADIEMINKYMKKLNDDYAKERDRRGLEKKVLFPDSPYSREYLKTYHRDTTGLGIVKLTKNFGSIMQIYQDKISYVTLTDEKQIGVIIENKSIYEMHRVLFEFMWSKVEKII